MGAAEKNGRAEERIGVLLLNMGGPDSLEAVEPFLFNLFNDNDIIPLPAGGLLLQRPLAKMISSRRARFVRGYYEKIGRKSPLGKITDKQALLLERRLRAAHPDGPDFRCYVAMRYWHPFTDEALERMAKDGVTRLVALTLYPHYTTATTESSLHELRRALCGPPEALGRMAGVDVLEIDRWCDEPAYLDALAGRVAFGLRKFPEAVRPGVMLLFSAHGLPVTFIAKGDPYVDHLHTTIAGVVARLARDAGTLHDWRLSFQSRAGPTRWLEPSTEDALKRLAAEGRREVLAIPISFVSDHIETLYEIDMLFGDEARALGLDFRRAPSLNLDGRFIEALARLVVRRLELPALEGDEAPGATVLGASARPAAGKATATSVGAATATEGRAARQEDEAAGLAATRNAG